MKSRHRLSSITPILIGFSILLIGVAEITALWVLTKVILPTSISSPSVEEVKPAKFIPQIYQLEIVNNRIQLTPKTIHTTTTSSKLALTQALEKLLAQPIGFDPVSTIPQQTRLLHLDITKDGVYVDLSQEFAQGGGSSSMIYRVAQVLYTATSIDSPSPVFLSIEGQPLNDNYPLGGEGLTLEYPMTRKQFNREFLAE
jgi:spore germination protein GerM